MGSRVRIRLFHILHFVMDFLFPLLKNSKSGDDDRGHRFRSGSPLTNYPHATAIPIDTSPARARHVMEKHRQADWQFSKRKTPVYNG